MVAWSSSRRECWLQLCDCLYTQQTSVCAIFGITSHDGHYRQPAWILSSALFLHLGVWGHAPYSFQRAFFSRSCTVTNVHFRSLHIPGCRYMVSFLCVCVYGYMFTHTYECLCTYLFLLCPPGSFGPSSPFLFFLHFLAVTCFGCCGTHFV